MSFLVPLGASRETFAQGKLGAGDGTIYVGAYSKKILVLDEATESVTHDIPLKTGIPKQAQLSADHTRLYVLASDLEHFEIVDLASRASIDVFALTEGNRKAIVYQFGADPLNRFLAIVSRPTTKEADRFEVGTPTISIYDLRAHRVINSAPWPADDDPSFFSALRISPDGCLLYLFGDQITIIDRATLRKTDSWALSKAGEPGFGDINLGSLDDANDQVAYYTGLFTTEDPVQKRRLLGIARIDLEHKSFDHHILGPALMRGTTQFAMSPNGQRGYVLVQDNPLQHSELWTVDLTAYRVIGRTEFAGRTRMALRVSSNGKVLFIHQAGHTIELYAESGFKYLRTIELPADMPYGSFHVVSHSNRGSTAAARNR